MFLGLFRPRELAVKSRMFEVHHKTLGEIATLGIFYNWNLKSNVLSSWA